MWGAQAFPTDERLGDRRALVQTARDRSLPRKGQVY